MSAAEACKRRCSINGGNGSPVLSMNDLQAQLQAAFEFQKRGKARRDTINTRHILFVVSVRLGIVKEQVARRVRQGQMGLALRPCR